MGVPTQNWDQIRRLVESALQHPPERRQAFLDSACSDNVSLRESVESLLASDDPHSDFLELPPFSDEFTELQNSDGQCRLGQSVGPYTIQQFVASGGMGDVYMAIRKDDPNRLPVAIKLLRENIHGANALRRFYRERRTLAALDHPNIATLLDAGTTKQETPYLVMEYVDGQPIHNHCQNHNLRLEQRLRLFCSVCNAVAHAHQHLIVHRDLKPANILVDEQGSPKLLDFGIAKLLDHDRDHYRTLTGDPRKAMTLRYASPEQIFGHTITTSCDVYSLGVILYELLTGRSPYDCPYGRPTSASISLEHAICHREPDRPSAVLAKDNTSPRKLLNALRGDLDTIVLTALQKDPAHRYDSVKAFRDDILRHLDNLPIHARRITFFYRTGKLIRRHKATTASLVIAALSVIFGFCALTAGLIRAEQEADRAARVNTFLQDTLAMADPLKEGTDHSITTLLDDAARRIDTELANEPALQADIHATLANSYQGLGRFHKAAEHWQRAVTLARTLHPTPSKRIADILINLGQTYSAVHDMPQAIAVTENALQTILSHDGPSSINYASALSARAILHQLEGQLDQAIALHNRALTIRRTKLPPEHHTITKNLLELATSLRLAGQLAQARIAVDEAADNLHGREQTRPKLFIDLLQQESSLARDEGDLDSARQALQQELSRRTTHFGPNHPACIYCLMRLAALSIQQDDFRTANDYATQACDICQRTWSKPTPKFANALLSLAGTFWATGDYESAETAARKALSILKELHDDANKPDLIAAQSTLAVILRDAGRYEEAEELLLQTLDVRIKWYGHNHRYTADTMANIASLYYLKCEYGLAEQFARSARNLRMQTLPPNHSDVTETNLLLGQILTATGNLTQARRLLEQSLQTATQACQPHHHRIAAAQSALAACLTKQQQFKRAEALLRESAATLSEILLPQHKLNRTTRQRLNLLRDAMNKPQHQPQFEARQQEELNSTRQ